MIDRGKKYLGSQHRSNGWTLRFALREMFWVGSYFGNEGMIVGFLTTFSGSEVNFSRSA